MKPTAIMFLTVVSLLIPFGAAVAQDAPSPDEDIAELVAAIRGGQPSAEPWLGKLRDGYLRFFRAPADGYVQVDSRRPRRKPEDVAMAFLARHAGAFGIRSRHIAFSIKKVKASLGRDYVHVYQTYGGLPVFGSGIVIQVCQSGVEAVISDIMRNTRDLDSQEVSLTPKISVKQAGGCAMAFVASEMAKSLGMSAASGLDAAGFLAVFGEPRLLIYDPDGMNREGDPVLAWELEIGPQGSYATHEVVVDAESGEVVFHFPLLQYTKVRDVYGPNPDFYNDPAYEHDGTPFNFVPSVDKPVRTESNEHSGCELPHSALPTDDQDNCHTEGELVTKADGLFTILGGVYDFYDYWHARDSIDNSGMTIEASVGDCWGFPWPWCQTEDEPPESYPCMIYTCDFTAFWNSGDAQAIILDTSYMVDDVVAHEYTHGVTQHESNLVYSGEPGGINEAFSDMWGEFFDWWYDPGSTDTEADRWYLGEDTGAGAIRYMKDPTEFQLPDRKGSPYWQDDADVHVLMGVGCKLCYLMTAGETFNGRTIAPVDEDLDNSMAWVLDLFYQVQATLLPSGEEASTADYEDLYYCLLDAAVTYELSDSQIDNITWACEAIQITPGSKVVELTSGHDECERLVDLCASGDCVLLKGDLYPNTSTLTPSASIKEYIFEDRNGNVVARIAGDSGNVYLKGSVSQEVSNPTPDTGTKAFKVHNAQDHCVVLIDENGNLKCAGVVWVNGEQYCD